MTNIDTKIPRSYSTRTTGVGSDGTKVPVMYMHCVSCCGPYSPENECRSTHVHHLSAWWRCVACDATTRRQTRRRYPKLDVSAEEAGRMLRAALDSLGWQS